MKVLLTGASGLLGRALTASLREDGHEVTRLVRREPAAPDESRWDPRSGTVDPVAIAGVAAVVNLAGPGLGARPWTPAYRRTVLEDRVAATRTITAAMAAADPRPRTLLSMSGVGFYGNPGEREVDEAEPRGDTYIAEIVDAWERETAVAADAGIRVARLRTGVVLSGRGGAFGPLLPIFRLGLGGRLGSGRQWWSWVALPDYVRAVRFLLEQHEIEGPVNVCSPEPIRNGDLTRAVGRVLHRPTVTFVPGFALRLPLRDFAEDLLAGQRVMPRRLQESGFAFEHPSFEPALRAVLGERYGTATS